MLDWYNTGEDYRYATGTGEKVKIEELEYKFDEFERSTHEFFLGIYILSEMEPLGIITGQIKGSSVWIKLLAVALEHRGLGLGSRSSALLLKHMKEKHNATDCYLSVIKKNENGRKFWLKNGFGEIHSLEKPKIIEGLEYDIIIMHKPL